MMAKFLLLNREEEYVQTLKNVTVAKGNKIINGEDTLDLTVFDTEIEKNYRILLQDNYGKWHEYIVQEIEESHTDKGIRKKVYCESSIYETIGDFIEDRRFNNTSALMALTGVLQHTRWKIGRVDDLGTESYSPYRVDAKTAIQTIAKTWEGELQTRIEVSGNKITGRYIDLLNKIGYDTGKRFSWTKDIQQIKRTVVRDDVITALYGFGKGEEVGEGFGRRLDFADINDGKMYVENNEAKEQFGRLDENGNKVHIFGKVEFDDETEKTTLKEKTEAELEVFSKPLLSYSADVLDLKQFGYDHEGYELGDTVLVIDKEFKPELRVLARIIEKETDYLEELNSNVTLGNFIPTSTSEDLKNEGYINNFRDKSGVWDRSNYISEDGRIFIDDLLDQLNAKANATGGYFYYTEGEGTITTDRPIDENPTMAVEIKGGSIRIADSKLPDGTWNWRTALTGKGIVADEINTGILKAALIQAGFNNIGDGFGVIISQDGLYSVSPKGEYSLVAEGGVQFYTKDDVLNGSIESSYTGDKTGVGVFIQPGHGFSVVRNNGVAEDNITIFQVPDDVDELRLRRHMNANAWNVFGANAYKTKRGEYEAIFMNYETGQSFIGGNTGARIGYLNPDGLIYHIADFRKEGDISFYRHLNMENWSIENVNKVSAEMFNLKGSNIYLIKSSNSGGAFIDTQKVSLGVGSNSSWSNKLEVNSTGTKLLSPLDVNGQTIEKVNLLSLGTGSTTSSLFTSTGGVLVAGGNSGMMLGARQSDGTVMNLFRIYPEGAHISYRDINMAGNNITNTSDIRLKKNITEPVLDAFNDVLKMKIANFEWDKDNPFNSEKPDGVQFGQIAQYAPAYMQIQNGNNDNYLSVSINKQVDLLTLAIQRLIKENESLKDKNKSLEDRLDSLEKTLKEKGLI